MVTQVMDLFNIGEKFTVQGMKTKLTPQDPISTEFLPVVLKNT